MGAHTVVEADAKEQLSELIDRALNGEAVRITRGERVAVEMKAVPAEPDLPKGPHDIEWLRRHRVGRIHPRLNAAELIRQMRDEGG